MSVVTAAPADYHANLYFREYELTAELPTTTVNGNCIGEVRVQGIRGSL